MWPVGRVTYSWEQAQCCFVGRPGRCACAGGWGVEGSAFLTIIITTIIFTITTIIFITISTDPMRGGGVCVHHHHHRHHHHNDYIHHRHDYLHHHRHCFIAKVLLLLLSSSLLLPAMARGRVIILKNVLVGVRVALMGVFGSCWSWSPFQSLDVPRDLDLGKKLLSCKWCHLSVKSCYPSIEKHVYMNMKQNIWLQHYFSVEVRDQRVLAVQQQLRRQRAIRWLSLIVIVLELVLVLTSLDSAIPRN